MITVVTWLLITAGNLWAPLLMQGPLTPDMKFHLENAGITYSNGSILAAGWRIQCLHAIYLYQFEATNHRDYQAEAFGSDPLLCMDF